MRKTLKPLWFLCLLLTLNRLSAQDLSTIKTQKPFKLGGSVGASTNFYSSNEPVSTQPPFAWNLHGNFNAEFYGVSLPFSFLVNQYSKSYTSPFTQFGLSPTYKWARLHLGYRTIAFSPLTFEGQSFKGAGIELNPGLFRFGAFSGRLNKAVNEDTTSGRFKMPQYSRTAYGLKLGVGNDANYLDFIFFHAKDDSLSATVINKLSNPRPQENAVLGTLFKLTFFKKLSWTSDVALSGLTMDQAYDRIADSTSPLAKTVNKVLTTNASTIADWAGQTAVSLNLNGFSTTVAYRRVQPDFKSLGTTYMLNDIEMINLASNLALSKGKVNINTTLATQHNNLNDQLASTLKTNSGTLNLNTFVSQHFSVNLNATGYGMQQDNGTMKINDSIRLQQSIMQFNLSPVYSTTSGMDAYTVSGNIGFGWLDDKNPVTAGTTENNTLNGSLSLSRYESARSLNLTLTGMYNRYEQANEVYTSTGGTLSAATQLLKSKALGVQGSAGYLFNKYTAGEAKGNLLFSATSTYRAGRHSFSAFGNYVLTPPSTISNINKVPQAVFTRNLAGGVSYVYSF